MDIRTLSIDLAKNLFRVPDASLYCARSAAIISNPLLRSYYEHLIDNGKLHKVALVATMRACCSS